jgi:hypothetical protein
VDISANLNDGLVQQHANRVQILDSLIHNHYHIIEQLIQKGSALEDSIRPINQKYLPFLVLFIISKIKILWLFLGIFSLKKN